jgi:hypothetical protein
VPECCLVKQSLCRENLRCTERFCDYQSLLAREKSQRLPQWIANTPMPVLDLYNSRDNGWSQTTVSQREIASIKSLKLQYRQRELHGFNTYHQYNVYLSKEIYGWLSHMGW